VQQLIPLAAIASILALAFLLTYAVEGKPFIFGANANIPLSDTLALGALPVIIFFAAIVSILWHLGIMQRIVRWACALWRQARSPI